MNIKLIYKWDCDRLSLFTSRFTSKITFLKITGMKYFQNRLTNSLSQRFSFQDPVLTWILRKTIQYICATKKKKFWSKLEHCLPGQSIMLLFSASALCNFKANRYAQLLPKAILKWDSVCLYLCTFRKCQPCKLCTLWRLYMYLYHISVPIKKVALSYDKNTALAVCKNIISKSWNQRTISE